MEDIPDRFLSLAGQRLKRILQNAEEMSDHSLEVLKMLAAHLAEREKRREEGCP